MSTAIITGASRGFGLALATDLAAAGWDLVVDARSESALAIAADTLGRVGSGSTRAIAGDVTDQHHLELLVTAALDLGDYRLLVNNASDLGQTPLPRLDFYSTDALRQVFEVNVLAPLTLTQVSLAHLRQTRGTIVNVTSDAAVEAYEGWGGYGATKAALEQMSNVLAVEENDVKVYWFDPGDMRTTMHQDAFPGEDISDRPLPESRVPALMALLASDAGSGRFTAESLLAELVAP